MYHPSGVVCLSFTPDGQRLVTGDQHGCIRVWDVERLSEVCSMQLPDEDGIGSLVMDEKTIYAGQKDVHVLDHRVSSVQSSLKHWRSPLHTMALSGNTLATGDRDRVRLWDLRSNVAQARLALACTNVDLHGNRLLVGNEVYDDVHTLSGLIPFPKPALSLPYSVGYALFSPDGSRIVSTFNENMSVYTMSSRKCVQIPIPHWQPCIRKFHVSSDYATLGYSSDVHVYNMEDGSQVEEITVPMMFIDEARFHPDDRLIAVSHRHDKMLRICSRRVYEV